MDTIGEVARLVKPADCTCQYPRVIARNMNGHDASCPVYQCWLAARNLHEPPRPGPTPITLRREELPDDEPRRDDPPPRREGQPGDSCLGHGIPALVPPDPRRQHEADPRGRHTRVPRQRRPQ